MNLTRTFVLGIAGLLLAWPFSLAHGENWTTTDGKVYQDVQVIHAEPDAVTILHHDGGALVPLAQLPPDLQQRFHYDPDQAAAAAQRRNKDESDSAQALRAERQEAWQLRHPEAQAQDTAPSDATSSGAAQAPSPASTSAENRHYSIDDVTGSAQTLRRNLAEPGYFTMAHLVYTVHTQGLRSDPSDSSHHSTSEVGGLAP